MKRAGEQRVFYRRVAWVSAVHLAVVLLFLIVPLVGGHFGEPPRTIVPIEFVVDTRTLKGPEQEGEGDEEVAEPEAPPAPEPPAPPAPPPKPAAPVKSTVVAPAEVKKPADGSGAGKSKVKVSTKKVKRPGRTPNPLTPEEIRSRLALGARAGNYNSAIPGEEERNFGLIYQALYRTWVQPSRESVGSRTVTASVRLGADGRISERTLVRRSGVPEFDRSVEEALNAVDRIPGLTVSFLERHRSVTILFEVE